MLNNSTWWFYIRSFLLGYLTANNENKNNKKHKNLEKIGSITLQACLRFFFSPFILCNIEGKMQVDNEHFVLYAILWTIFV